MPAMKQQGYQWLSKSGPETNSISITCKVVNQASSQDLLNKSVYSGAQQAVVLKVLQVNLIDSSLRATVTKGRRATLRRIQTIYLFYTLKISQKKQLLN